MNRNPFAFDSGSLNIWGAPKSERKRQLTHSQKIYCWENNPHTCIVCSKRVNKFSDAEFDHKKAFSKGGATNLGNVKIVHRQCNRLKGTKSLSETKKLLGIKSKTKRKGKTRKRSKSLADPFGIRPFRVPKLGF